MTEKTSSKTGAAFRTRRFRVSRSEALEAAGRFIKAADGKNYVMRFSLGQKVEHFILLTSFLLLGITGLSQTYSASSFGEGVLKLLGGIDTVRQLHHFSAVVLGLLSFNHILLFIYYYFLTGNPLPKVLPAWSDVDHLMQMIKLNLGMASRYPRFDRYSFEQKTDYWVVAIMIVVMGITGVMQWFPILTTAFLPGWAIPVGRAIHKWEAILAILFFLIWHLYHNVIKKINLSIFTGLMTVEEMQTEHPVELAYLQNVAAAGASSAQWPVLIEIPVEEAPSRSAGPATGESPKTMQDETTSEPTGEIK